jgi:hypothetical protein
MEMMLEKPVNFFLGRACNRKGWEMILGIKDRPASLKAGCWFTAYQLAQDK